MLLLICAEIQISNKGKIIKTKKIESDVSYLKQNLQAFFNKEKADEQYPHDCYYKLKSLTAGDVVYETDHPTFIQIEKLIEDLSF